MKKAFTLIELLVVMAIMVAVFSLVQVNFKDKSNIKQSITLLKTLSRDTNELLICYDECSKCAIFDLNYTLKRDITFKNFDNNLTSYDIDYDGDLLESEYKSISIDERDYNVCLEYSFYKNNSSQKKIIKYFNNYYLFHSFFKDYQLFNNLEDAQKAYIDEDTFPKDEIEYHGKFNEI